MMDASQPRLSLVVPVYNEQETLPELHRRIKQVMETWESSYELILVNDGSIDRSLEIIRGLQEYDHRVIWQVFPEDYLQAEQSLVKFK